MKIGGFQKLSLIDYPGKLAAVIFTRGCNFRCPFCHNPELIPATGQTGNEEKDFSTDEIMDILRNRKNLLEGICLTGGEPLLQPDIEEFIKEIKKMGYKIKLDTNGYLPKKLAYLIDSRLIDFVAMDIKNSFEKYAKTCGVEIETANIRESIKLIMQSGLEYEFRTTVVKELHNKEDILKIAEEIKGAKEFALQKFEIRDKIFNEEFLHATSISQKEALDWQHDCMHYVAHCQLKGWT